MNPQDLKRLIAGFLVFSVITSIFTLVSLNFIGTADPQQDALQVEGDNSLSTVSKNAFVEKLPSTGQQTSGTNNTQSAYVASASDSSNLTQNVATIFASQMMDNNQNGPQLDQNGDPTVLKMPGEDKTAEMIRQALSKTAFTFDDKTSIPAGKIAKSFSPEDVSSYLKQVYEILGQVSSSTRASMVANQSSTDALVLPALAIEAAFDKLYSLPVPKPFIGTHTALLRFFANQKNVFNAVTDYQTDPMKTMLAVQNENEIISRDLALVKSAAMKVDTKAISSNISEWENIYSEILGVKKAYALFGAGDIVFDPATFGQAVATVGTLISNNLARITEWLYTTALEIAKNILINEFQNEVVNWIAGGGNPKFITDWGGFLRDVGNKAAGQAIYELIPQACSGFGPLLRVALLPVPYANTGVRCTLTQVVSNVNNFFNSFKTGSWVAYSYAMQPNNNYFGSLIVAQDRVLLETINAQQAANSQAQASKGFLSVKKCVDERTDDNGAKWCAKEIDTTPGAVVGETLTTSLGWAGNKIISTSRFEALVAAIVNASINRIVKEGLSALTEAMNPPPPSYSGATPSGVANPGSLGSTITNVNNLISSLDQVGVFQQNQNIITADTQWLSLALSTSTTSAITALNRLSGSCPTISNQVSQRITDLNSLSIIVLGELNDANALNNLRTAASSASSTQSIAAIVGQLQTIDIQKIGNTATTAQQRLASLQYFTSFVQDIQPYAYGYSGCSATLPSVTSTPPLMNPY